VLGAALDRAIGELLVETMRPLPVEVALAVQDELEARAQDVDRIRGQQVERAPYEAELAQRRYLRVVPDHRVVADSHEAEWNSKLRALAAAQDEYDRQRNAEGNVSALSNAARCFARSRTSLASGVIRPPPSGSASAWCACCWKT
jgi:hypothetical protein